MSTFAITFTLETECFSPLDLKLYCLVSSVNTMPSPVPDTPTTHQLYLY